MTGGTLVVGAGEAAVRLAVSLRQLGDTEPITLAGAEPHPPYQRPPLSKDFLAGTSGQASLALRSSAFYQQHRIGLLLSRRVTELRLSTSGPPGSGSATTDDGSTLSFDRLALTVGARPRRVDVPGNDLDGVLHLRDLDDARQLRSRLDAAERVVVVGGGFMGLEVASVARAKGCGVVVVEAADRVLGRSVAPVMSTFYQDLHTRRGVDVRLGVAAVAFEGSAGRVVGVELSGGERVPAELVLVAVGIVPRTELAEQIGLACDDGIVVDGYARTSETSVVAAGDCTVFPNPVTGVGRVRLESVPNAMGQAAVAAAALAGRPRRYRDVPWFWSDQYGLKLQIAGLVHGHDRYVLRGEPGGEAFSVLYYRGDTLLAINSVNRAADYMAVRRALSQGTTIPAELAGDLDRPLNGMARPATRPIEPTR